MCQTSVEADETVREFGICVQDTRAVPGPKTTPQAASLERLVAGSCSTRCTQRTHVLLHCACSHLCVTSHGSQHLTVAPKHFCDVLCCFSGYEICSTQTKLSYKFKWKHKKNKNWICFTCSIESTVLETL